MTANGSRPTGPQIPGVKRFFDNFLFFLNLIGIFTLLLAGIGIQSSLTAFLRRTGADHRHHESSRAPEAASSSGTISPWSPSSASPGRSSASPRAFCSREILPGLFHGLLPANMELAISRQRSVLEGLVLGCLVVLLFTLLPLYRLKEVKPRAIFGKEEQSTGRSRPTWLTGMRQCRLFFHAMVLWRIREMKTGLVLRPRRRAAHHRSLSAAPRDILRFLRRNCRPKNLVLRQALKGLFRPGNATRVDHRHPDRLTCRDLHHHPR